MITFAIATLLATTQPKQPISEVGFKISKIEPAPEPIKALHFDLIDEVVVQPDPVVQNKPIMASGVVEGCGDNQYANYIYMHESGCRLDANNGKCVGIGQACPASKLYAVCPDLNYACQNGFFTDYANSAYGGWEKAYQFWLGHSWW